MSLLKDIVDKQTSYSTLSVFNSTIDKLAEEMAKEILKDKEFKHEMQELVKIAFRKALKELQEEK